MAKSDAKLRMVSSAADVLSKGFSSPPVARVDTASSSFILWRDAVLSSAKGYLPPATAKDLKMAHASYLEAKDCFSFFGFTVTADFYAKFLSYLVSSWGFDGQGISKLLVKHGLASTFVYRSGDYPQLDRLSKGGTSSALAKLYISEVLAVEKGYMQTEKFEGDCTLLVNDFSMQVILVKEPQGSKVVQLINPLISNHPKFSLELLALTEAHLSKQGYLVKSWSHLPPKQVLELITAIKGGKATLDTLLNVL